MEYLIYRYGANSYNQTRRWKMPLAIIQAKSKAEALKIAYNYHEVYNNQHLEAIPVSRAKRKDLDEVWLGTLKYNEFHNIKRHPQIIATQEAWELF
jgi:hypothetical protein